MNRKNKTAGDKPAVNRGQKTTVQYHAFVVDNDTTIPFHGQAKEQLEQQMTAADASGDVAGWVDLFLVWLDCPGGGEL